jgi:hypothetical protein
VKRVGGAAAGAACGAGWSVGTARGATAGGEVPATGEEGKVAIGETVGLGSNRMSK